MASAARPFTAESATTAAVAMKATTASAKYSAGPNTVARSASTGAKNTTRMVASRPPVNAPIAAVANACGAAAALGHPMALEGGRDRRGVAGGVHQDRGRRVAEQAAVVDPGEHDERADRVQAEGDRQQQGHRHRRTKAGQHTDRGAQHAPDEHPQQVHRRQHRPNPCIRLLSWSMSEHPRQESGRQVQTEQGAEDQLDQRGHHQRDRRGRTPVDATRGRS